MLCGDRLRELRKGKALTQGKLGTLLGISQSAVGMYERGEREPDSTLLSRIADFFGVTIDYLYGRDPEEEQEVLEAIRRLLCSQQGLMFNGEALSATELEQIYRAIEMGTEIAMARQREKSEGRR